VLKASSRAGDVVVTAVATCAAKASDDSPGTPEDDPAADSAGEEGAEPSAIQDTALRLAGMAKARSRAGDMVVAAVATGAAKASGDSPGTPEDDPAAGSAGEEGAEPYTVQGAGSRLAGLGAHCLSGGVFRPMTSSCRLGGAFTLGEPAAPWLRILRLGRASGRGG